MAKDYSYLMGPEFEQAKRAVLDIDSAFAACGVVLTDDELNAMKGSVRYHFLPYMKEKLIRQAYINAGLSEEEYNTSSADTKSFVRAQAELASHKFDAFCEEWGVPNIDGGPYRIVREDKFRAGKEIVARIDRHTEAGTWLHFGSHNIKLTDYFTQGSNGMELRADWEINLKVAYTAVIPLDERKAWDTLQSIKKDLHKLAGWLQPYGVNLGQLCEAADDPNRFVSALTWQ